MPRHTHTRRTRYHVLQDKEQICCEIHGRYRLEQMGQTCVNGYMESITSRSL